MLDQADEDPRGLGAVDPIEKATIAAKLFGTRDPITVGRFEVIGRLGSGGMGVVYRARDPKLQRDVAVKLLSADLGRAEDSQGHRRLLREAQAMAKISHPNVLPVYEAGEHDGRVFVAMELVEGGTLRDWLGETRSYQEIVGVFLQAARGLAAAHERGLVHRDFKPENVLVDGGESPRIRVMDFGLAATSDRPDPAKRGEPIDGADVRLTQTGAVMGTPAYMSPEQFDGRGADERSDQFSLCVALWEGLCGQRPFAGQSIHELAANVAAGELRRVQTRLEAPSSLLRCVERGLAPSPDDRHPDLSALIVELERHVAPRRSMAAVAAMALLVGGGVTVAVLANRDPSCVPATDRLAGIWDEAKRARLDAKFEEVADVYYVPRSWELLRDTTDAWVEEWTRAYEATCEAEPADDPAAQLLHAQRTACLDAALANLEMTVQLNMQTDKKVVAAAGYGLQLPALELCADDAAVARALPLPSQAQLREDVARLRRVMARVSRTQLRPSPQKAAADALPLIERARALGYRPVLAEAKALFARAQASSDPEDARPAIREALREAEIAEHEAVRFQMLAMLHGTIADDVGFTDIPIAADPQVTAERRLLLQQLETAAQRDGVTQAMKDQVRSAEASGAATDGDLARAIEIYEEQLQRYEAEGRIGAQAGVLQNMGGAYYRARRPQEALRHWERSTAMWDAYLGENHPVSWRPRASQAQVLLRFRRFSEGVAMLDQASAGLRAIHPQGHSLGGFIDSQAALGMMMEGRPTEALARLRTAEKEMTRAQGAAAEATLRNGTLHLARWHLTRGEYEEVAPRLARLLDPTTNMETRVFGFGIAAEYAARQGDETKLREHLAVFEKVVQQSGSPAMMVCGLELSRGVDLLILGDLDGAAAAARKALSAMENSPPFDGLFPFDVQSSILLGHVLSAQGKYDEALPFLEDALTKTPGVASFQLIPMGTWVRADLARSLWETGGDRKRALELAAAAQRGYQTMNITELAPESAELDRWIAARRTTR